MKAKITEHNRISDDRKKYPFHIDITLTVETPQEGMELGFLASTLRQRDIWCTIHKEKCALTIKTESEKRET